MGEGLHPPLRFRAECPADTTLAMTRSPAINGTMSVKSDSPSAHGRTVTPQNTDTAAGSANLTVRCV